jgi:dTDP-4-amino-4,6-dideoxygalactose transaminase
LRAAAGGVPIVEDAAQALNALYQGRPLGSFGALGALSFHETKNIGSGEGGALLVNDASFIERAEYLRDKGTNRRRFLNGLVDKYTWVDEGSSYVLSDLNAAYLWAQLEQLERIQTRRHQVWAAYEQGLTSPAQAKGIVRLAQTPKTQGNAHLFALVMRTGEQRGRFIEFMRARGVMCPFHYVSLHRSPMGSRFHDGRPLPMTERLSECLVRLPLFFNITDAEVAHVIGCAREFIDAEA